MKFKIICLTNAFSVNEQSNYLTKIGGNFKNLNPEKKTHSAKIILISVAWLCWKQSSGISSGLSNSLCSFYVSL